MSIEVKTMPLDEVAKHIPNHDELTVGEQVSLPDGRVLQKATGMWWYVFPEDEDRVTGKLGPQPQDKYIDLSHGYPGPANEIGDPSAPVHGFFVLGLIIGGILTYVAMTY
jgi:hypothetical protein